MNNSSKALTTAILLLLSSSVGYLSLDSDSSGEPEGWITVDSNDGSSTDSSMGLGNGIIPAVKEEPKTQPKLPSGPIVIKPKTPIEKTDDQVEEEPAEPEQPVEPELPQPETENEMESEPIVSEPEPEVVLPPVPEEPVSREVSFSQRVWYKQEEVSGVVSSANNFTTLALSSDSVKNRHQSPLADLVSGYVYDNNPAGANGVTADKATYQIGREVVVAELSGPDDVRDNNEDMSLVPSYTLTVRTLEDGEESKIGSVFHLDGNLKIMRYEAPCDLYPEGRECGLEEIVWYERGSLPPLGICYLQFFTGESCKEPFPVKIAYNREPYNGILTRVSLERGEVLPPIPVMQEVSAKPAQRTLLFPGADERLFSEGLSAEEALEGLRALQEAEEVNNVLETGGCVGGFQIGKPSTPEETVVVGAVQGFLYYKANQTFKMLLFSEGGQSKAWEWQWEKTWNVSPSGDITQDNEEYGVKSIGYESLPYNCQSIQKEPSPALNVMDSFSRAMEIDGFSEPTAFVFRHLQVGGIEGDRIPTYTTVAASEIWGLGLVAIQSAADGSWTQLQVGPGGTTEFDQ